MDLSLYTRSGSVQIVQKGQGSDGAVPREWREAATKSPATSKDKIYKLLSHKYEEIFLIKLNAFAS